MNIKRRTFLLGSVAAAVTRPAAAIALSNSPAEQPFSAPKLPLRSYTLADLVVLAPGLVPYLRHVPPADWRDLVYAARQLATKLGISKSTWVAARMAVGEQSAALAVVLIARKPNPTVAFEKLISSSESFDLLVWRELTL